MTDPLETFARRLRQARERAGMTQTELAHKLSELLGNALDPSAITRIEKRERGVRLEEAVHIAEILGVPLAILTSDRDARELEIDDLRRQVEEQRDRGLAAMHEFEQAQLTIADLEARIAGLEARRDAER